MDVVGLGFYFEDLPVGRRFRTIGRTVTEADITNFVNCTGMVEVLFTNTEFLREEVGYQAATGSGGIELLLCRGTAGASDHAAYWICVSAYGLQCERPVFAGDTIHVECEVIEARLSRNRPGRGLVRTRNQVVKQDGAVALTYTPLRMMKCREGMRPPSPALLRSATLDQVQGRLSPAVRERPTYGVTVRVVSGPARRAARRRTD